MQFYKNYSTLHYFDARIISLHKTVKMQSNLMICQVVITWSCEMQWFTFGRKFTCVHPRRTRCKVAKAYSEIWFNKPTINPPEINKTNNFQKEILILSTWLLSNYLIWYIILKLIFRKIQPHDYRRNSNVWLDIWINEPSRNQ